MDFKQIAQNEYRNFHVFKVLAQTETNPDFKSILTQLTDFEEAHYQFWLSLIRPRPQLTSPPLWWFKVLRKVLGLTFVLRYLEREEDEMIENVRHFLFSTDHAEKKTMEDVIYVDEPREQKLLKQLSEDRVKHTGSIVLGLNDGLIELSGALTGFSFAFRHNPTVVLAGIILGISASLSMGSSAYLQARQERGKDAVRSALYVGFSYFLVLAVLLWPYAVFHSFYIPIVLMVLSIIAIVASLSYYTAVIFDRNFRQSFFEMFIFSMGTAIVTFLIGTIARDALGISI